MTAKTDTITIKIRGKKKFRQTIIDVVYAALMGDDLQFEATKQDNGFTLDSSIAPSEEVEE